MALLGSTASSSGLDKALTDATGWVERYVTGGSLDGSIRRSVVRETVAGSGSQQLMLSRTPVIAVARIFSATSTSDATEYCSTDFRIESPSAGFVTLTNDGGFDWSAPSRFYIDRYPAPSAVVRPWLVEYEAGWQYVETSSTSNDWISTTTGRTVPDEVQRAVLLKAAEFAQGSATNIESMRVGPLSVNYSSEAIDPIVDLLSAYRRVF